MSREVKIGNVGIGGKNPVRVKGMLKSPVSSLKAFTREARRLEREGAEALRIAVKEKEASRLPQVLKGKIKVPLAADIHFHPKFALMAIDGGYDCIRLNPLNIKKASEVRKIARAALSKGISIRVGINSGGFVKRFSSSDKIAREMVKRTEDYLSLLESENFFDIMVSLKGSDVSSTIIANRLFSQKKDYPLHIGVTATGTLLEGVVKSSLGLGNLLYSGIGDVIRVSLTAPSFWEIRAAKLILQSLGLRNWGVEVISCPTCSRCEVNLIDIAERFKKALNKEKIEKPLRIAIMGCVVNGPGEAAQADIGAAFGKEKAVIFKKSRIVKRSSKESIIKDLIAEVKKYGCQ